MLTQETIKSVWHAQSNVRTHNTNYTRKETPRDTGAFRTYSYSSFSPPTHWHAKFLHLHYLKIYIWTIFTIATRAELNEIAWKKKLKSYPFLPTSLVNFISFNRPRQSSSNVHLQKLLQKKHTRMSAYNHISTFSLIWTKEKKRNQKNNW